MENLTQILEQVSSASGMHGLSQVTTLHGYLEEVGKVEIESHDRGEDDDLRYAVYAKTLDLPEEKTATGNPASELDTAIATTHWYQLKP